MKIQQINFADLYTQYIVSLTGVRRVRIRSSLSFKNNDYSFKLEMKNLYSALKFL